MFGRARGPFVAACACVALALAAGAANAGTTNWIEAARKFKDKAIEHLRQAEGPSADKAQAGKNALAQLNVARMLLETKYQEPRPAEVVRELEEVNSLIYWTRKMLPVEATGVDIRPVEPPAGKSRDELAREFFEKAEDFARRNPDNLFLQAVRYFEVADRFQGTTWSVKANGLSLELQRRMRSEAGPDKTSLIKELGDVVSRPEFTQEEKLQFCEKLLGELPADDPLRPEVAAMRAIFGAATPADQAAAAAAYFRDFAQGRFASHLEGLKGLAGEPEAYDAVVAAVRSAGPNEQKAKSVRAYLDRFPSSPRRAEMELVAAALSAKYAHDEATAWMKYRLSFPSGALKDQATAVLQKNESAMHAQLRSALMDGDDARFKAISDVYLEIVPKGPGASEVRSILALLAAPTMADRLRLAQTHLGAHAHGALTPVLREVVERWRKGDEDAAFRRLADAFAAAKTPQQRVSAANEFLKAYPRSSFAAEVRACLSVLTLDGVRARLEAARKYLASYPDGAFAPGIRELEQSLAGERSDELYRAAKVSLSDPKTTYSARIAAAEAYLAEFPEGERSRELRSAIESVNRLLAEEAAAFERLAAALEGLSSFSEGVRLCEEFIQKYSPGPHYQEVVSRKQDLLKRLDAQREAEAYAALTAKLAGKELSRVQKVDECLRFLKEYGQGPHRREVGAELRKLAPGRLKGHAGPVRAAAFSTDGTSLVTCDADRSVAGSGLWVWKLPEGALDRKYRTRPAFTVGSMLAAPRDTSFWIGESSGGLFVWNLSDGSVGPRMRLGRGPIRAISSTADGTVVATASLGDGKARTWDPLEWVPEEGFPGGGGVSAAAVSPTGDAVAVGTVDGRIRVFRPGSAEPVWSKDVYRGEVDALAFGPGGNALVSASKAGGKVCLWGGLSGNLIWEVEEPSTSLAFVGSDAVITGPSLRMAVDGRVAAELGGSGPVAVSQDGKWAFTGGDENEGILWYLPALMWK